MADTKITALGALTGVADGDDLVIVDVSDTTMAASGTTKKVTALDLQKYVLADMPTTAPSAPPNGASLFSRPMGGRQMASEIDPSGLITVLQPAFARNKIGIWLPTGNVAAVPIATGIAAPSTTGTTTIRNVATTNMATSLRRVGMVSAATAPSLAALRNAAAQWWRGNATGLGGFTLVYRFVVSDAATVSGARMFMGLSPGTGAPTNVEPNTLTDCIGVCQLSSSGNLQVITNDNAGTATTTDLGASFPANTLSADAYEAAFFCAPNGSQITYEITRLNTGNTATGTITTDLPTAATLMAINLWRSNNATALACAFDLVSLYIETDN